MREVTCCPHAPLQHNTGRPSLVQAKELVETCPKAKELFDRASEILGYDLLKASTGGKGLSPRI